MAKKEIGVCLYKNENDSMKREMSWIETKRQRSPGM